MFFYFYALYINFCCNHNYSKKDDITIEREDYYV